MKILTHRTFLCLLPALALGWTAPASAAQAPAQPEPVWIPSHVGTRAPSAEDALRRPPSARLLPAGYPRDLWFVLPAIDLGLVAEEDATAPAGQPLRIGVPIGVDVALEGQDAGWIALDGGRLWISTFTAPGAKGMRLELDELDLPAGAELWIRDDTGRFQGPIEGKGPLGTGEMWSQDFFADTVLVEYWLPDSARSDGAFRIPRAQHLYRGVEFLGGGGAPEGACHEDVMCYAPWQPLHNATVRFTFVDGGTFLCSAALLGTVAADETPYLLTANHCVSTNSVAATVSSDFFFQTASCNTGAASSPTVNNASLVVTNGSVDITLLMLNGALPANPTWAGWDTANFNTGTPLTTIHHPGGARKKISFGDRITYPFGGGGSTFYWGVSWNTGTIEGGTSGSPLYRDSNHLLVGVASHSEVPQSCSNPDGPSGYGKFNWFYNNVANVQTLLAAGSDDAFEPNNSCAAAPLLGASTNNNLVIKSVADDWYRFSVPNCDRLTLDLTHTNAWGDVDAEVYDACGGSIVASNLSSAGTKNLVVDNQTGSTHTYYLRVFLGTGNADTRNNYNLVVGFTSVPNCTSDPFPKFCNAADNSTFFCPCGNGGNPESGCDNSAATGGVLAEVTAYNQGLLTATITCTDFPPTGNPTALLIRATNKEAFPVVFGDGLRCVGLTGFTRLAATTAAGGTASHSVSHGAGPGTFYYQSWYRNTPAFCTTDQFNLSNGVTITW